MTTTQATRHYASGLSSQRCPATRQLMPNRVRNFDRFHISYNDRSSDYGCPTTALVLDGRVFLVLNGDHVEAMVDAAEQGGLPGCIDLFIDRIEQANLLSEHAMAFELAVDPFGLQATATGLLGMAIFDRAATEIRRSLS